MWGCSAVGSAPPWRGGGRGFDSRQLHQIIMKKSTEQGWYHEKNLVPGNNLINYLRRDFTFKEEDRDGRKI